MISRPAAVDPIHGMRGKQRSMHNTYFTLPVLFAMLSNHYSFTYSHPQNWLVLILMMFAGAAIRQFFVLRHGFKLGSQRTLALRSSGRGGDSGRHVWLKPVPLLQFNSCRADSTGAGDKFGYKELQPVLASAATYAMAPRCR